MGFINAIVKHDSVDISTSTISYNRDHQICSGIGTLELIVPRNIGRTFNPWDVIEIWENGNKKGKFFIDAVSDGAKDGVIQIAATDGSKKLTDYFITDTHTIDYLSHGRYWIEKFLDEAGVTYSFTVSGNGSPLSNNTSLGFDSAFNTITTLLQQSGWYLYFNNDGTAIIGDLNKDLSNPDHTITDADFTTLERELDDDRLRNRAVVWGNSNPTYGEVFVDISVPTPWNYDANDKRAVVISNSSIYSNDQALALAQKMLNEFTQIKDEKTLLVVEDYNLQLGEILKVTSPTWDGRGLITGITATMSKDGLVYLVNINKKCPRLFTFYSTLPPTVSGFYVYVGTLADGIWRKHTQGSSWYNDSSGLQNLEVKDLFIRNGVFASVSGDGYLYTRTSEISPWYKYEHPSLKDRKGYSYPASDIMAKACSISSSDTVVAGYNYAPVTETTSGVSVSGISWVLELTGSRSLLKAEQVVISGLDEVGASIVDLESAGEYNIVSATTDDEVWEEGLKSLFQGNANSPRTAQHFLNAWNGVSGGSDKIQLLPADSQSYSWAPPSGDIKVNRVLTTDYSTDSICGLIKDRNNLFYSATIDSFSVIDPENWVKRIYKIKPTLEMTNPNGTSIYEINLFVRRITSRKFDVIMTGRGLDPAYHYYIRHFTYTLNDTEFVYQGGYTIEEGASCGVFLLGTTLIWAMTEGADGDHTSVFYKYNLITKSTNKTEVLRYTNAMLPHNGVKENYWRYIVCGAGDTYYLISYWVEAESWDQCVFMPPSLPYRPTNQDVTFYGKYTKLTSYGSETVVGPTIIDSVSVDSLNDCSIDLWGPYEYGSDYGANPMTRHVYFRIEWDKNWSTEGDGSCSSIWNSMQHEDHFCYFKIPGWIKINHKINPDPEPMWKDWNLGSQNGISLHSRFGGPWGVVSDIQQEDDLSFVDWSTGKESHREDLASPLYSYFKCSGQRDDIRQQPTRRTSDAGYVSEWFSPRTWQTYTRMRGGSAHDFVGMIGKWPVTYAYGRWYIYDAVDISQYENGVGRILKHTSTDANTISGYLASEDSFYQTQGNFEVIYNSTNPCKVDIAKGAPTVIYDIPTSSYVTENFGASIQNTPGSFYTHSDPKQVYESKVFDLPKPGTFPTASGTFDPSDYERFIGISNYEGLLASEYYLNTPWVNMVTVASGVVVSGLISHFETSNFVPEGTYFFYTVSGIVSFYQKNPDEGYWRDYSAGLPTSDITNIRVDDMI